MFQCHVTDILGKNQYVNDNIKHKMIIDSKLNLSDKEKTILRFKLQNKTVMVKANQTQKYVQTRKTQKHLQKMQILV